MLSHQCTIYRSSGIKLQHSFLANCWDHDKMCPTESSSDCKNGQLVVCRVASINSCSLRTAFADNKGNRQHSLLMSTLWRHSCRTTEEVCVFNESICLLCWQVTRAITQQTNNVASQWWWRAVMASYRWPWPGLRDSTQWQHLLLMLSNYI